MALSEQSRGSNENILGCRKLAVRSFDKRRQSRNHERRSIPLDERDGGERAAYSNTRATMNQFFLYRRG